MPRHDRHTHPGMKRRHAEARWRRRQRLAERHAADDHGGCSPRSCPLAAANRRQTSAPTWRD